MRNNVPTFILCFKQFKLAVCAALLFNAASVNALPVFYDTDIVPNANVTNFNGFELAPQLVPPPSAYVEDGIRVEQINGRLPGIDTHWPLSLPGFEGNKSWYPDAGDFGYTRITRADGLDFVTMSFIAGSGLHPINCGGSCFQVSLLYELFNDGALVLAGNIPYFDLNLPERFGFSGSSFDEMLLRNGLTQNAVGAPPSYSLFESFHDGTINALSVDSIELTNTAPVPNSEPLRVGGASVPEPETYILMLTGLGIMGFMARRRKEAP